MKTINCQWQRFPKNKNFLTVFVKAMDQKQHFL